MPCNLRRTHYPVFDPPPATRAAMKRTGLQGRRAACPHPLPTLAARTKSCFRHPVRAIVAIASQRLTTARGRDSLGRGGPASALGACRVSKSWLCRGQLGRRYKQHLIAGDCQHPMFLRFIAVLSISMLAQDQDGQPRTRPKYKSSSLEYKPGFPNCMSFASLAPFADAGHRSPHCPRRGREGKFQLFRH